MRPRDEGALGPIDGPPTGGKAAEGGGVSNAEYWIKKPLKGASVGETADAWNSTFTDTTFWNSCRYALPSWLESTRKDPHPVRRHVTRSAIFPALSTDLMT